MNFSVKMRSLFLFTVITVCLMNRLGIMHPHEAVASCCNLPLSLSLIKLSSFPFSKDTLLKLARNRMSSVNFSFSGR